MNILTIDFNADDAAKHFSDSLEHTGFAVIKNHPIDPKLIEAIYSEWTTYFNGSTKENDLFNKSTQDGYFPPSVSETAKGSSLKDIKEYFQYYPWGQYPNSLSNQTKQLYEQLTNVAAQLLYWLEGCIPDEVKNHLSMPFSKMIENSSQTMLRILHYPPFSGQEPIGSVRAATHEDINLITVLIGATSSGLQVQNNQGDWYDVPCSQENLVINAGDMLSLATNGFYRSTTHRVVNPDGNNEARLSMPLFLHPRPEVQLSESKTAKAYLHERLTELGVI